MGAAECPACADTGVRTPIGTSGNFSLSHILTSIGGFQLDFFGPSGVRALPVAAGTNKGDHYFWYFSSYSSSSGNPPAFTPEGIVVGF